MNGEIVLREYQKSDRGELVDIIRKTWNYDRFCSPKVAQKMARVYLDSCLSNQTFTRVAVVGQTPVGIIMGKNVAAHKCSVSLRLRWMGSIISLLSCREGRKISQIFSGVDGIDRELLSASGKDYAGELAFFALRDTCRGKGLGRKLFEALVEYMRSEDIPEFYLYTDTSCNFAFYEHLGMVRRCEQKKAVLVNEEVGDMTFFLYDYAC